ncbi:MAG: DUF6090 family protein [Polaribacter sp.]|uniref:DUF6090 family protein n=1 Tax=Polaribacter sp. TaxID=1920175 RepID=UPI003BB13F47
MENKTSKYFKYAIGEIVLVVIGILIALQINNWNENNNLSKKEVALLTDLKNDVEGDITNLKRQDSLFAKSEIDAALGITLFYKATTAKEIDLVFTLTDGFWNELSIQRNTFNQMINSGSLYTMQNKNLQKQINKYYSSVEAHIEYIRGVNLMLSNLWEQNPDIYPAKFLISQLKKPQVDLKKIDTTWIQNPKSATYLSVDNYINTTQNLNNIYRREVFRRLITSAEKLRVSIIDEIELRK